MYEEVLKSKDLQKEFVACKKEEDITSFLKKNGCEAKIDEVKKFLEEKFTKEGKVNDKEIERLKSGGCAGFVEDIFLSGGTLFIGCGIKLIVSATKEGKVICGDAPTDSILCEDSHETKMKRVFDQ